MIWLASFPRSGNTFVRNILYHVYGIPSSAFHRMMDLPLNSKYSTYPVVKTHVLPEHLDPSDDRIPAVYIVRDGRDAVVSLAYQRRLLVSVGSDLRRNLKEAIRAKGGSHFGGWSANVEAWLKRADIIIRFEDLIQRPIECIEAFRYIMSLPEPRNEQVPTFEEMKAGRTEYGHGGKKDPDDYSVHFFRRGQPGSWRDDMDDHLLRLYWRKHGKTMDKLGYYRDGRGIKELPMIEDFNEVNGVLVRRDRLDRATRAGNGRSLTGRIRNRVTIASIHIPKTAGTSFRNVLKAVYGERRVARLDISKRWGIRVDEKPFNATALPDEIGVVHGHFRYRDLMERFDRASGLKVITWLRDPVNRVISNYRYLSERLDHFMDEKNRGLNILSKMKRSLIEYARCEINRNRMTKFLDGVNLRDLDFVGVVEYLQQDLERLARLLGWSTYPIYHHNSSPDLAGDIDRSIIDEIRDLNDQDLRLYEEALMLRKTGIGIHD